jgi:hypothetical protein
MNIEHEHEHDEHEQKTKKLKKQKAPCTMHHASCIMHHAECNMVWFPFFTDMQNDLAQAKNNRSISTPNYSSIVTITAAG